ncbi:nickel-responsive transcriptional regulator NikR [Candidatus Bathyarchaeota archaeon]|nr:nickel-responsive transcriptional regulator NikR [Candidatus Bathyarchaeota archaeon]MBS7627663.1 nickel-responsive transcriptional regulator NikR [Candidatus Bathyarchaeota archaeon]
MVPMPNRVVRFSISLPPKLVNEMDEAWKKMGYENRSKAIHDAIRTFITEFKWMHDEGGQITGAILLLYYLDIPGLIDEVMGIQHRFKNIIFSTMHLHLEGNKCLEIIAIKGSAKEVRELTQGLMTKRGIKQVKVATLAP